MSCQVFRPIADVLWAGVLFPVWCCSGRPPGGDPGRCAQSGRCSLDHRGPECLALSCAEGLQGGAAIQLRDGGHALGGEHAAALQLPVLVLLQQHRPHQAGDRGVFGENAHHGGAALYFFIRPLEQVGSPDFFLVGLWEVAEGKHVVPGLMQWPPAKFVYSAAGLGSAPPARRPDRPSETRS